MDESDALLSRSERRALALRLTLALAAAGCLIISLAWEVITPSQRDVAQLVAGIAAALVGWPAVSAAWRSLKAPDLHGVTDQLIALAFIAAWASGDLLTATLLPLIMTIGHILEERSLLGSQEAIRALTRLTLSTARRVDTVGVVEVAATDLRVGDLIEVRAGDQIPADGIVETGSSNVDTASITGESVPAEVEPGTEVFNGSINLEGHLTVRINRVGGETTLGRVIQLMQEAERTKPAVTRVLEHYAGRYLIFVLFLAACVWFLSGSTVGMLAVLVASCPCALVLAAPATSIAAIAVASRHGILVKGAAFLEQLATVDAVIFDKTGTLTLGQLRLMGTVPQPNIAVPSMLQLAASLGAASSHPVSRALSSQLPEKDRLAIGELRESKGLGVVGQLNGHAVALGRPLLFTELGIKTPPPPAHDGPIAGLASGKTFWGWLLLADQLRAEAKDAADQLKGLGLERQIVITGDREREARRVAGQIGVTEVRAEAMPSDKMRFVLDEIQAGRRPMVVGDGINDALALKAGAVGIAMGAQGTDVALASADLVLMTNDLRRLATCIRLSRRCRQTILVNVGLGLGWTILLIALAAGGTFGSNGALIAAILHNVGTLAVMLNAGRLLKFHDTDPGSPERA
jgi:Cd2+/Zn2+-exporting ATPase